MQAKVDTSVVTKRESPNKNKKQGVKEKTSIIQEQDEDLDEDDQDNYEWHEVDGQPPTMDIYMSELRIMEEEQEILETESIKPVATLAGYCVHSTLVPAIVPILFFPPTEQIDYKGK